MSDIAIKFENVSKQYQLGSIGTGTLSHDLKRWWTVNVRGKEDPYLKIGQINDRSMKATEDFVWALRNISLEVKNGEVLGIIGKNGAGKSTLLKILSRVTTPTTGEICANGRIASLLEVGTGFHPEMTGRENIYMNGAIMGMTRYEITRKLDEIVDFAGVEKYIDTPVKRYSSGMTVRLGFAIAAYLEPEILVVDEVLAVGDAEFQKKAIGKMQDVSQSSGRTVLFVSHNLTSISNLCSSVCVLNNGMLDYLGDTNTGIERYLNTTVINSDTENTKILDKRLFPNDNDFELEDIKIFQENTDSLSFYSTKPIVVQFFYRTKSKTSGLRIGFDLVDYSNGIILFRTFHDDINETISSEIGYYSATAYIPPNLLKPGNYSLKIAIGIHNVRWISFEKMSIPIAIHNISGVNKQYADSRPGIIMPSIKWDNVKIKK
jgi:lipopolysaccharide transport system ATP-binding protein